MIKMLTYCIDIYVPVCGKIRWSLHAKMISISLSVDAMCFVEARRIEEQNT